MNPGCECGRYAYNAREHRVYGLPCHQWSCARCRPGLIWQLFLRTQEASSVFGLDKHIIVTAPGKDWREDHDEKQQYELFSKDWYRLKQVLTYYYGRFDYVCFLRSQSSGSPHNHILANQYIPKNFLKKKASKYPNLGFTSIQQNPDVASYLTKDFWKIHEYVIPDGYRHFSASKHVAPYMTMTGKEAEDIVVMDIPKYGNVLQVAEQVVEHKMGYPAPFDQYLIEFYKNLDKNRSVLPGHYVNEELMNIGKSVVREEV